MEKTSITDIRAAIKAVQCYGGDEKGFVLRALNKALVEKIDEEINRLEGRICYLQWIKEETRG